MWNDHLYLRVIVPSSVLLPLIMGLWRFRGLSAGYRILWYYLLFAGSMNVVSTILAVRKVPNLYLLHWYTIAEFILLSLYFVRIPRGGPSKWTLILVGLLFGLAALLNLLSVNQFNTYSRPAEAIILSAYCVIYFYKGGSEPDGVWSNNGVNWIVSGMLLYFSGAFLLFVFSDMILNAQNRPLRMLVWNIHGSLVMVMYLLISAGLYYAKDHR